MWGADNVTGTTLVRYLPPGYAIDDVAPTMPVNMRTRAGTISKLRIEHNQPGTSVDVNVYTVVVNGIVSAVTVTLANNAEFAADNVNSVLVPNDAKIVIRVDKPQQVSGGTICREIVATVEFGP